MSLDLTRIILKQTFLLPRKSEDLPRLILNELNKDNITFDEFGQWLLFSKHGKCIIYVLNPLYDYCYSSGVFNQVEYQKIKNEIDKCSKEFQNMKDSEITEFLRSKYSGCQPREIQVDIVASDENGGRIEVACLPWLYFRITQQKETDIDELIIQETNLTSERFLKTIFSGGLSGILVSERDHFISKEKSILLINDVKKHQIAQKLEKVLNSATGEVLIIGWMGTILLTKLRVLKEKGLTIKVITGYSKEIRGNVMQQEKEKAFEELVSIITLNNICTRRDFHGRAIIVDNKAFIGSMDLDSYSLTGPRNEIAIFTENPEIVRGIRNYFNENFYPKKAHNKN